MAPVQAIWLRQDMNVGLNRAFGFCWIMVCWCAMARCVLYGPFRISRCCGASGSATSRKLSTGNRGSKHISPCSMLACVACGRFCKERRSPPKCSSQNPRWSGSKASMPVIRLRIISTRCWRRVCWPGLVSGSSWSRPPG